MGRNGKTSISYNRSATIWLGIWLDFQINLKTHHEKWTSKVRKQQARIYRLCHKYGLQPGSVVNLQRVVVQSVTTYGIEFNSI
jgi:hypothetical protein